MLAYPKTIYTSSAASPLTQVVKAGDFYFISGQTPKDYRTKQMLLGSITEQAEQVCQNIQSMLESVSLSFHDVAKTTCYLADMQDAAAFNEVYKKYFISKPARVCVAVKELPQGVLCEIECIAYGG